MHLQPKPLVSIQSTSGIVPDPSQYYSKDESYSTTTPSNSLTAIDEPGSYPTQKFPAQYDKNTHLQPTQNPPGKTNFGLESTYENFDSQKYSSYVQPEVVSSNYVESPSVRYTYTPSDISSNYNLALTNVGSIETLHESSTHKPELSSVKPLSSNDADIQIVSFLADTDSAIDVTGKGSQSSQGGAVGVSKGTHTISAILVAENDHKLEENEVNLKSVTNFPHEIISTTSSPKSLFRPIIVPDATLQPAVSTTERPYEASTIVYKDSKFYKSSSVYPEISDAEVKYKIISDVRDSSHNVDISTVAPTPDPVLVTPKSATKQYTSSESILAPIQAAVSLSHSESNNDCDDSISEINTNIEPANIREEAVYTTSIDIQKSIPFEIISKEQVEQSNIHNQNNFNISYGNNYNYEEQLPENVNYENPNEIKYSPNSFIQQVIQSYQKLSNSNDEQGIQEHERYINVNPSNTVPVQNQQYYIPNRLYYVYLQRYNPYINRYAEHPNVHSSTLSLGQNDGGQYTQTPASNLNVLNVNSNPQQQPIYTQAYTTQTVSDFRNSNNDFPSYVNQEQIADNEGRQAIHINQVGLNANYKKLEGNNYEIQSSGQFTVPSSEFEKSIEKSQTSFGQSHRHSGGVTFNNEEAPSSQQVVNANGIQSNSYQHNVEFANNLANLYATQLNALRSLESEKNINAENGKEHFNLQFDNSDDNNGDVTNTGNIKLNSYTDRENILSNINGKVENSNLLINSQQGLGNQYNIEQKQDITILANSIPQATLAGNSNAGELHVSPPESHSVRYTQIVEKPVPVEITKFVEKPVAVPHPVPIEVTKVIQVEKPVAVPVPVTKLVEVDRPVPQPYPVPHPVPLPYEVPHPIGVPVPHYIPYPHVIPVPFKEYHPVYIYAKKERVDYGRNNHNVNRQNPVYQVPFTPSQEVFTSQYPPRTYHVSGYLKSPHNRGQGKKLCIEYGGFKPPLIPSVQIDEEKANSYAALGKHR